MASKTATDVFIELLAPSVHDHQQILRLPSGPSCKTRGPRQSQGALMIRSFTVVALMYMTSGETATAFDLTKTLKDLMPCKYAAIRLCERPQHVSAADLWKCGATLAAAPQEEIGKRCVAVLRRYGAALN
jgi:hypothetical protein